MVEEGDNDSFDMSIVNDPEDDPFTYNGQSQQSQQSQQTLSSQALSSQGMRLGSQDSIHDFAEKADDEQVILRAPFQPSLSSTRRISLDQDKTPVPELRMPALRMPSVDVSNQRGDNRYETRSAHSNTIRQMPVKRRIVRREDSSPTRPKPNPKPNEQPQRPSLSERFTTSAPELLFEMVSWVINTLLMAFRYLQRPIAILLALYLVVGTFMTAKNVIVRHISAPFAPLCQIPVVSWINLPFCPESSSDSGPRRGSSSVEFEELMNVQARFEEVLENAAQGVSLPLDMKRSEASVRDLRTVVKHSELPSRAELVHEFDNYVTIIRSSANDLQTFNTRVGSAVDNVISINRWTSRYIDSIAMNREANNNMLSRFSGWIFSPFQVSVFDEQALVDKYMEHTGLVSDKILKLVIEAQAIIRQFEIADETLATIKDHVERTNNVVKEKHDEVYWNIWTLVGANGRQLHNLESQMHLLKQVDAQRHLAVRRLTSLVHDLRDIETKLSDLRERVAAPQLVADTANIPLSVHIETINAGVERLDAARSRIRAEENERLQQAIQRSKEEPKMIDG